MLKRMFSATNLFLSLSVFGVSILTLGVADVLAIASLNGEELPAPIQTDGGVPVQVLNANLPTASDGESVPTLTLPENLVGTGNAEVEVAGDTAPVVPAPVNNPNTIISLTAVPPRMGDDYSLTLKPGQTTQVVLEVRNPGDEPVSIQSLAKDFVIGDDGETPLPIEEVDASNRWSLASWLTITPNNATIAPKESVSILVTIAVPQDAMPGGHYAMVLHKPATAGGSGAATGSQVSTQVGTLIYVVVEGEITEDAFLTNFNFTSFSENGPVDYGFDFQNESSMHVRPEISMVIKNAFGQVKEEIAMEQKNVFPGSTRHYEGSWDKVWGFGPYKAEVIATYGKDSVKTVTATTSFWIIPLKLILAVLLVIAIIVAIIVGMKRKYKKMLQLEETKVQKLDEKLKKSREENRQLETEVSAETVVGESN